MSARLKPHPAAELFPVLPDAEIDELAADILARGQLHKGVVLDGLILDGRHREEACHRVGVAFVYETWADVVARSSDPVRASMSPTEWVLSTNLRRRHLNETQRAVIGEEALPLLEVEAKKRMAAAGGDRRSDRVAPRGATRFCWHEYDGANCTEAPDHRGPHRYNAPGRARSELAKEAKKGKASEVAAKAMGSSARSIERAKAVLKKRPELRQVLKAGKQTLKQVEKAIKKEEALKNVAEYRPPVGTFSVILTDVSWEYDDKLDGSDRARGGVDYASQKLDEIMKMKIPAAADCALWFCVTNQFLMDGTAARVLAAWDFTPKALLTWRKIDKAGNDRLGSGHYLRNNTEHVILAVRGKPLISGADQPSFFEAPRTSTHSEKPDRLFEIAEKVTPCAPEARIELNARKARPGWAGSGADLQAKERGKLSPGDRARLEAQVRPEADAYPISAHDLLGAAAREPARVEQAPFSLITWFRAQRELPRVAIGHGRTGRYAVDRHGRGFRWALVLDAEGRAVKGWPESPAFESLDAAKADAEVIEQNRCATLPSVPAMLEPRLVTDRCGAVDGHTGPKNGACLHAAGHDGPHSNGRRTWPGKKLKGKPSRPNMQVRDV